MPHDPTAPRPYHKADKITDRGDVSALCFAQPRPIDLTRASWTTRPEAVTCPKCLALLKAKPQAA